MSVANGGKAKVVWQNDWGYQWNKDNWVCMKRAAGSGTYAGVVRRDCTLSRTVVA